MSKIGFYHQYQAKIKNGLVIIALLFLLAACDSFCGVAIDCGCVEADDFGEYQQGVVTVKANGKDGSCEFDMSKDLSDPSQGSGLYNCLNSDSTTIKIDSAGTITDYDSKKGCAGFTDSNGGAAVKQSCIADCISKCQAGNASANFGVEPIWVSTKDTFTLKAGYEISIIASGSISLADSVKLGPFFVKPDIFSLQSKDKDSNDVIADVKSGGSKALEFQGQWTDSEDSGNPTASVAIGPGEVNYLYSVDATKLANIYNGNRRVVLYVQPHPAGYLRDASFSNEKTRMLGVPMEPDTGLWYCTYQAGSSTSLTESTCDSLPYDKDSGYDNIPSTVDLGIYKITSAQKSDNLTKLGGIIRWKDDGLRSLEDSTGPFFKGGSNIVCAASGNCKSTGADYISNKDTGMMIGKALAATDVFRYTNNSKNSIAVSFINLSTDASCNGNYLKVNHFDSSNNEIFPKRSTDNIITIGNSWGKENNLFYLEPGDILKMSGTAGKERCTEFYGFRIDPVHRLTMQTSGMVKFTMLGGTNASGSCNLSLKIVNPRGNRLASSKLEQDFYEYGEASDDANIITNINVPTSLTSIADPKAARTYNWSKQIFVRKGQEIRFSPKSWNGTWTAESVTVKQMRQCGIAMAMQIEPRLALLCRGQTDEDIQDPRCKTDDTNPNVCKAWAAECYDQANTENMYCPADGSIKPSDGSEALNCQSKYDDKKCKTDIVNSTTCANCLAKAEINAFLKPQINLILDQCYDLENYNGKVANIPIGTGFSEEDLKDNNVAKGAVPLRNFDGYYGNLEAFSTLGKKDGKSVIYRTSENVTFNTSGRLKFMVLDGTDFNISSSDTSAAKNFTGQDSYNNNLTGTTYDGTNGYLINLKGTDDYFNGDMMEVYLCKDVKDDKGVLQQKCGSASTPTQISGQPYVVKIDGAPLFSIKSSYKFNDFGRLTRIVNPSTEGAVPASSSTIGTSSAISNYVMPNSEYYVHSETSDVENIRLSFKIKDTDIPNCVISAPKINDDCKTSKCDGIVRQNNFYIRDEDNYDIIETTNIKGGVDKTIKYKDKNNNNNICDALTKPGAEAGQCQRQYYCANIYANNSGSYNVLVRVKDPKGANISSIVDNVVTPVIELMDGTPPGVVPKKMGQAERMYTLLVNDPVFKTMTRAILMLAITFYGLGYLMGVSQFSQSEIINRVVKIGIIFLFISPNGWEWFDKIFVKFFKEGTDYLAFLMATSFDNSPEIAKALKNNDFYDKSVLFSSIDNVFGLFFSDAAQKKIIGLLFASIFGWAYLLIIYSAFMLYVYAVANAVLLYLTSQVFISILFILGPLFFLFLFFNQTKGMFDKWIGQLTGFALQQIFLLTTLSFFNMMMYEVVKLSLGYRVCWDEIWAINRPVRISIISFWHVASLPPRYSSQTPVGNVGNNSGIPSLFSILFIWIIASLMKQFIAFMTDLAASIGGSAKASEMGKGLADLASGVKGKVSGVAKKTWEKYGQKRIQQLDKYLFNSGKIADSERATRKAENAKNFGIKRDMAKAGEKAVQEFKRNNAAKLATMKPNEIQDELKKVREQAMIAKGVDAGLDEKKARDLMNGKGLKYEGDNLFGAAAQAIRQGASDGGSLFTAMSDRNVNQSFSKKDIDEAMKNTDAEGRKKIEEGVQKGNLALRGAKKDESAMTEDQARDEAEKELVATGKIARMRMGTGWARDKSEKDQIANLAKEKLLKSQSQSVVNSNDAIANVQMARAIADELETGKGGQFTRAEGSIGAKLLGRERGITSKLSQNKQKNEFAKALEEDRSVQMNDLDKERSTSYDSMVNHQQIAQSHRQKAQELSENGKLSEVKDLEEQLKGTSIISKTPIANMMKRARLNKAISNIKSQKEYQDDLKEYESHTADAIIHEGEAENEQRRHESADRKMQYLQNKQKSAKNDNAKKEENADNSSDNDDFDDNDLGSNNSSNSNGSKKDKKVPKSQDKYAVESNDEDDNDGSGGAGAVDADGFHDIGGAKPKVDNKVQNKAVASNNSKNIDGQIAKAQTAAPEEVQLDSGGEGDKGEATESRTEGPDSQTQAAQEVQETQPPKQAATQEETKEKQKSTNSTTADEKVGAFSRLGQAIGNAFSRIMDMF